MRSLKTLTFAAILMAALTAAPLDAQQRGGGNARSSSNTRSTTQQQRSSSNNSRPTNSGSSRSSNNSSRSSGNSGGSSVNRSNSSQRKQNSGVPRSNGGNVRKETRPARSVTPPAARPDNGQANKPATPLRKPGNGQNKPGNNNGNVRPDNGRPGNNGNIARPNQGNLDRNKPGGRPADGKPDRPAVQPSRPGNGQPPKPGVNRPGNPVGMRPPHERPEPPRHRDPIRYDRPSRFWDRGPHYFGYRVTRLPGHYVRKVYWGVPYYVVGDVYYRYIDGVYYVSRPPYGVAFVTPATDVLAASLCNFAFYANNYYIYRTMNQNAELITKQNRIIAENNALIASQNATIAMNADKARGSMSLADELGLVQSYASASDQYYYDDGVFYSKDASGQYVTIVPPAGALVTELPEDYETVIINGDEYYRVDKTIYKVSVIDGTIYFEVLGQQTV